MSRERKVEDIERRLSAVALDTSPQAIIRMGSGLVYAVLGVYVLLVKPRRTANMWLGVLLLSFGLVFVVNNLTATDAQLLRPAFVVGTLLALISIIACLALLRLQAAQLPPDGQRSVRFTLIAGAVLAVVAAIILYGARAEYAAFQRITPDAADYLYVVAVAGFGLIVAFAGFGVGAIETIRAKPYEGIGGGSLAAVYPWVAFIGINAMVPVGFAMRMGSQFLVAAVVATLIVLAPIAAALRATRPVAGRLARNFLSALYAIMAIAVIGMAFPRIGQPGILRIIAVAPLAYAVFQTDLLGADLQKVRIPAAALGWIALAVLFMVAQIEQAFLVSATNSLWFGSAAAGLVLLAAYPVQRMVERTTTRRPARLIDYQRQVEFAWADGHLGPKERALLAGLRTSMKIPAEAALQVEEEVAASYGRGTPATNLKGTYSSLDS